MDDKVLASLETRFTVLENELNVIRKKLEDSRPSYQLTAARKISTMCRVSFVMKQCLERNLDSSKMQLRRVEELIKRKQSKLRRRRKPKSNLLVSTSANSSFYFRTGAFGCKVNNYDCISIAKSNHTFLNQLPVSKRWRPSDQTKLHNGVRQYIIERESQKMIESMNTIYNAIKSTSDSEEVNQFGRSFEQMKLQIGELRQAELIDLLESYECDNIDWQRVSQLFRIPRFTGEECQAMWQLVANPLINNRKWTRVEDLLLNCLVSLNNYQNWEKINKKLNHGRTAFMCFSRYQQAKKLPNKPPRRWTARENNLIRRRICKRPIGPVQRNFYSNFAKNFSVSRSQLRSHIHHITNHDEMKKGTFSFREKFLLDLYLRKRYPQEQITQKMRRSRKQVYDVRLRNKTCNDRRRWTTSEVHKLLVTIKYSGAMRWIEISKYLERPAWSCRMKYLQLKAKHPELIEQYNKKKPNLTHIQTLIKDRVCLGSARKKYSVDEKIESYFIRQNDQNFAETFDCNGVAKHVVHLLKFFNFDVNVPESRMYELGQWLLNNKPTIKDESNFSNCFESICVDKKNLKFDKNAKFSSLVSKTSPVLPPNKCTMHGVNHVQNNLEKMCSSAGIDFGTVWRNVNSDQAQNRNFNEAKLLWYQILKGLLYWPIKLNTMPLDKFL